MSEVIKIYPYASFGLLCAGIELMGKCLDETKGFNEYKKKLSGQQFDSAINTLFPNEYKIFITNKIYNKLRNGMLHSLLPNPGVWLRERNNTQYAHLAEADMYGQKMLVIIVEDFNDDIGKAVEILIRKIDNGELIHPKIKADFLETTEV